MVEWIGREGLDPDTHGEYLQNFITHFYKNITKLVDRAMRKEDSSAQGQIVTEILQHLHACNNSVRVSILALRCCHIDQDAENIFQLRNIFQVFYGREESLVRIKEYIMNECDKPLVFYGAGGCGKTSLLAKSAALTQAEWLKNSKPLCVVRFLGTTPDSSALTPALVSICHQVDKIGGQFQANCIHFTCCCLLLKVQIVILNSICRYLTTICYHLKTFQMILYL